MRKPFVVELRGDIFDIAINIVGALAEAVEVAVYSPQHEREHRERDVPRRTVAPIEAPAAGRNNAGESSVLALSPAYASQPLDEAVLNVHIHKELLSGQRGVARPAVLFAVRTVGGEVVEVRAV